MLTNLVDDHKPSAAPFSHVHILDEQRSCSHLMVMFNNANTNSTGSVMHVKALSQSTFTPHALSSPLLSRFFISHLFIPAPSLMLVLKKC